MKKNDTLIKINLLGKEFLAPTHIPAADTASNHPHFVTALFKKLAQQVRHHIC